MTKNLRFVDAAFLAAGPMLLHAAAGVQIVTPLAGPEVSGSADGIGPVPLIQAPTSDLHCRDERRKAS